MPDVLAPDAPVSFGYKCSWLAVRADSPADVAAALGLRETQPSTWAAGVPLAYGELVFVTPPLDGWILAAGISLPGTGDEGNPDRITSVLLELGRRFPDVQYFGTHRVVEWHAWARVVRGEALRKFAYVGDQGYLIWNHGEITSEERKLGLLFTPDSLDAGQCPDEENVMALAGLWSVDPCAIADRGLPPSLGIVGVYPN